MTNFRIEIVSDTVCPWCYIGKKRLDKAIGLYQKVYPNGKTDTFTIIWRPFYLDPDAPAQGIPYRERFEQRVGPEKATALMARLRTIGAQEGIAFSFAGRIGRTRDSHRLIELAGRKDGGRVQDAVVAALFERYFEGEGDITGLETLVAAGVQGGGMEERELRRALEAGEGGEEVDREVQAAREKGIRGVPWFLVQGEYEVDGAQEVQDFMDVFVKVKEAEEGQA